MHPMTINRINGRPIINIYYINLSYYSETDKHFPSFNLKCSLQDLQLKFSFPVQVKQES